VAEEDHRRISFLPAILVCFAQRQRPLVDVSTRLTGDGCYFGDGFLDGKPHERIAQQRIKCVGIGRVRLGVWGRDHNDNLTTGFRIARVMAGERSKVAVANLLVQFCKFPAKRSRSVPETLGEICKRFRHA
jgi:hypothetical protein